ncbi:MAG: amidophosphoribosyltransferase [Bacteroidetes bacterium]|nr:amidophosphoribosyltransferase [Bacteroidota bacterium]
MCGIVGIISDKPVAGEIYDSLIQLQHRGQDAAGIITCNERMHFKTGQGLVRDIFQDRHMKRLEGNMGIGHTRYPTSGGKTGNDEVQPFWTSVPNGIAFAHNGNIVNYEELRNDVINNRNRYLNTHSDSEMIMQLFADVLQQCLGNTPSSKTTDSTFFNALCFTGSELFSLVKGAVSAVSIIKDRGLIAFRDPHGIRPLVMGERESADSRIPGRKEYIFASEDTMFYMLGFKRVRDVIPGEMIFISYDGEIQSRVITQKSFNPCIFEYVYFSRPDAMINNISVYRSRLRMGENLGKKWKRKFGDLRPDVIIPAPSTSNTMALAMARELGVNYSEGLHKNTFIGRTFIMPNQEQRKQSVRYKLVPQELEIRNKDVMIVDDSIVRGTTSKEIVMMLKEFGAKKIYFASACSPVITPCYYGVDIPTSEELIASTQSVDEICEYLGADLLMYQEIEDLIEAVMRKGDHHIDTPCYACLGGTYIYEK